jgi:hypothetical protein
LELDGCKWFASGLGRFTFKTTGNHWRERWVGPRAGPDISKESLSPAGIQTAIPRSKNAKKISLFHSKHPTFIIIIIITNKCTINIIKVHITAMYNLYSYMFRHFHVIIREFTSAPG